MSSNQKRIAIAALLLVLLTPLFYSLGEKIKRRPEFCISCHIDSPTPRHIKKQKSFVKNVPVDLAGFHKSKSKDFSCTDCHAGRTLSIKMQIAVLETYNTFLHFLAKRVEPQSMKAKLMPDDNCTVCHKGSAESPESFHGLKPHIPSVSVPCISCHFAHIAGRPDYNFIDTDKIKQACKRCHPNLSEAFTRVLK